MIEEQFPELTIEIFMQVTEKLLLPAKVQS